VQEKNVRQDRTGHQKSHKGVIFHPSGRSPHGTDLHKNLHRVVVPNVIWCSNFQIEIFGGYGFTGGQIFDFFLLIFAWALQQCSADALPVILAHATPQRCPVRK